jgi:hypothetical protein
MFDTLLSLITSVNTEVAAKDTYAKEAQAKESKVGLALADAKYTNIVLLDNKAAISNISLAA